MGAGSTIGMGSTITMGSTRSLFGSYFSINNASCVPDFHGQEIHCYKELWNVDGKDRECNYIKTAMGQCTQAMILIGLGAVWVTCRIHHGN